MVGSRMSHLFRQPSSPMGLLRQVFSDGPPSTGPSPSDLLHWTFSVRSSLLDLLHRIFSVGTSPSIDLLQLSTYVTSLVHMIYMLQLEGGVENHRIFSGLSPSFLVHYFHSFLYFILFHSFIYIYIYIYIYI